MTRMTPIAPLIDQLQDIARDEIPAPRTCSVKLWDDGDYHIVICHKHAPDEQEGVYYDVETGEVVWKYIRNGEWVVDDEADDRPGYGTAYVMEFEETNERVLTVIEPPV